MNLKIDRALPCPPSSHPGLTLTYLPLLDSVMLYVHVSTTEEKLEEPKKKFTFKVDKQTAIADIFWLYSVPKRCWTSQETKGKIPSRRERMVTIFLYPCVIVYGGRSLLPPHKLLNDVYTLNVQTWTWKKLFAIETPPADEANALVKINAHKLLLLSQTLWVLTLADVKWYLNANELPGAVWTKVGLYIPPNIRCGVSFDHQIILFGGDKNLFYRISLYKTAIEPIDSPEVSGQITLAQLFAHDSSLLLSIDSRFMSYEMTNGRLELSNEGYMSIPLGRLVKLQSEKYDAFTLFGMVPNSEPFQLSIDNLNEQDTERQVSRKNSCIAEESHYSSMIYDKSNYAESPQSQKGSGLKGLPYDLAGIKSLGDGQIYSEVLKEQLRKILVQEFLKRKILEEKAKLLEGAIKKAEKMVLSLCKFSHYREKRNHIERMKEIRQYLETVWLRELSFRKEIEARESPFSLSLINYHIRPEFMRYLQ